MRSLYIVLAAAMLLGGIGAAQAETTCVFDNRTDQRLNMAQNNADALLAMERFSPCSEATAALGAVPNMASRPERQSITWRDRIRLYGPDMLCESTPQNPEMLLWCAIGRLPWASTGAFEIYERRAIPERDYRRDLGIYLDGQPHLHSCYSGGRSGIDVADELVEVTVRPARGTFTAWELRGIFPDCPNDAPHMVAVRGVDIPLPLGDYGVFVVAVRAGYLSDLNAIELEVSADMNTLVDGIIDLVGAEPAS